MDVNYVGTVAEHDAYVARAQITQREGHNTQVSAGQFNLESHVQQQVAVVEQRAVFQTQRKPKRIIPPEKQRRTYKQWELVLLKRKLEEKQFSLVIGQRQSKIDLDMALQLRMSVSSVKAYRLKHMAGIDITIINTRGPEKILKTDDLKQIVASVRAENTVKETAHEINVVHQQQAHPEFTPDQIQEAANTEPHVSPTTVYNALKDKELMDLIGESTMSYVRSVDRVANANSPENKMARLENILEYESKVGGKVRVFVDESHWTLGGLRQYGWVETGHKRLNNFNEVNYSITALSAIVETGVAYTEIAIGNITADIFEAFMCNLIAWLKDAVNDADCVFYLDNASIHKDRTQLIVNQAKHTFRSSKFMRTQPN
ncbi:Conserved_hypothetical protein [Hexamita inflata]|uniref:Tc1-like transposase DDE domain-containing protein n=1 Tax=Hexamita inflata TaxID=28002 RepID=A0AA86N3X8_9EUKA|nr:Conserved hypothetical protein [Hexamita inflata]